MTGTAKVGWTVDKDGKEVEMPKYCPAWCKEHADYVLENWGLLTAEEIHTHRSHGIDDFLADLANPVSHQVTRPGGGHYDAHIRCGSRTGEAVIQFALFTLRGPRVDLDLTSGEVRTMAAQLLKLADIIDLG